MFGRNTPATISHHSFSNCGKMNKRPLSIALIAALFLVAGAVGLAYHATEIKASDLFRADLILALLVRLLAVIGAIYLWRGKNWARWLLVLWLAYHVVLSAFHSISETVMHALLLAIITFVLFRPSLSRYFVYSNAREQNQ